MSDYNKLKIAKSYLAEFGSVSKDLAEWLIEQVEILHRIESNDRSQERGGPNDR